MRSGDRPGLQKWAALSAACFFKDITGPRFPIVGGIRGCTGANEGQIEGQFGLEVVASLVLGFSHWRVASLLSEDRSPIGFQHDLNGHPIRTSNRRFLGLAAHGSQF